jgi:hypothetical protein
MSLILPDRVLIEQENARVEAVVDASLGRSKEFFRQLQEFDPTLDLVLAHEGANAEDPRFRDGFWHIRRMNRGINDSVMPITTPDGRWAEPQEYHLNLLRDRDLWRDGGIDRIYAQIRAREKESADRALQSRLAKKEEFAGRYKSAESPGILFGTPGWRARLGEPDA